MTVDMQAAINMAITLARSQDMTSAELADILVAIGLERVGAASIGASAGLTATVGLSVYRSVAVGFTILITHRYVFIVGGEKRVFAIAREPRTFIVDRGE